MRKKLEFVLKNKYKLLTLALFLFFFIQMQFVFFYGDDFEVLYPIHNNHEIFNILNFCFDKLNYFWFQWSGRIIGHAVVTFGLSFFGINFFRILNPIMVLIFVYLILKILKLFKQFNFEKLFFYFSFIFLGMNVYLSREILYWAYSSILYLWGFNLILFVIYIVYKNYLENKKIEKNFFIWVIIATISSVFILEQFSFILLFFFSIMFYFSWKNHKNYKQIFALLCVLVLSIIVYLMAPGRFLRTKPLVEELELYNNIQIILGKTHSLFNIIFNPKLLGMYISIFMLLLSKKYLSIINNKFRYKIPYIFILSYFFILIISKIFNINLLLFNETYDAMNPLYKISFLSNVEKTLLISALVLIILYYIALIINLFYMVYKVFYKENKFLFYMLLIGLGTTIITAVLIRYIGMRYYVYFFISILFLSIYLILDLKNNSFDIKSLFFLGCSLPYNYSIAVSVIILIILFMNDKLYKKMSKNSNKIVYLLCTLICLFNLFDTFFGYVRNSKIYKKNEELLINTNDDIAFSIDAIPDSDKLYGWHIINTRWNITDKYYGFYLNKFYKSYYGIDMDNVYIKTEDGYYVK